MSPASTGAVCFGPQMPQDALQQISSVPQVVSPHWTCFLCLALAELLG